MRGLLLFAAGAVFILLVQMSPVPIGPPPVTCSLAERRCPEVFWFHDIHWTNDTPTIRSVEFRELPLDWGRELPFEPEWAAAVENYFDPTNSAACLSDPEGGVECHYLEYGGDPEDLPWYVPSPRERFLAWCRDPENKPSIFSAADELNIGQAAVSESDPITTFQEEYQDWQDMGGDFTEHLDRACQAAYANR